MSVKIIAALEARVAELETENTALRAIATKTMPCHYCGVDEIAKCPSGFPGCALMDDVMCAGSLMRDHIQKLRSLIEIPERLLKPYDQKEKKAEQ